jgi:hypothetical protein
MFAAGRAPGSFVGAGRGSSHRAFVAMGLRARGSASPIARFATAERVRYCTWNVALR